MTGIVVLSAPKSKPPAKTQAEMMLREFAQASEDSIVTGQSQAFGLYEEAYVFFEFVDGEWRIKSETSWPENLDVSFFKEDIELDIPEEPLPLVVFEPVGLSTPFSLWLEDGDATVIFSSAGDGRVAMEHDQ